MDAIDLDGERGVETDVTDEVGLLDSGKGVETCLVEEAVALEGIDGEIGDTERGEVLEEVGALRGIDLEVVETCFDDDACGRDIGPLDGNAQPGVGRAPTSRADVDAMTVVGKQLAVDLLDVLGNRGVLAGTVALGRLDIDDVLHVGNDAVADGGVRTEQALGVGNLGEVFVELHVVIDHWTNLEQIEGARFARGEIDGKFDFDRSAHLLLSVLQHLLHEFGEGEEPVVEHSGKADDLAVAALVIAIVDAARATS